MMRSPKINRKPWNGVWTVKASPDYIPGLYRMHQVIAHGFLKSGTPLTEWECNFLQTLALQPAELLDIQSHWLNRIERDLIGADV